MGLAQTYKKVTAWPLGKTIFSFMASMKAPYFGSICPKIHELTESKCIVFFRKQRRVENHIGTVHAIAMCNACELSFGLVMEAGIPNHLRWIPKGMTVRYLKKAETDLTATCDYPEVARLTAGDHSVPVKVRDAKGQIVMEADITVYISEKQKK
jgi:acyl-coenzyme A thioesterase PaaI-like protein